MGMRSGCFLYLLSVGCALSVSCACNQQLVESRVVAEMKATRIGKVEWHDADTDEVLQFLEKASGLDKRGRSSIYFRLVSIPSIPRFESKVTLSLEGVSLYETLQYVETLWGVRWRVEGNTVIMTYVSGEGVDPKVYEDLLRKSGHH